MTEDEIDSLDNSPLGASSVMDLIKYWHDRAVLAEARLSATRADTNAVELSTAPRQRVVFRDRVHGQNRPDDDQFGCGCVPVATVWTTFDWLCSTHDRAAVKTSTKTGRRFVGCPDCHQFARPGETPREPMADRTTVIQRLIALVRTPPPSWSPPDDLPF